MNLDFFKEKIIMEDKTPLNKSNHNILARYYKGLLLAEKLLPEQELFSLENAFLKLPELSEDYIDFFKGSEISWFDLTDYGNHTMALINLMNNPICQTTKVFASILTVARIINHIKKTNEKVIIITPSSGNKALAFRNAVAKAISLNLITEEQLRTITVVPKSAQAKFKFTTLESNESYRKLNPIFTFCENPRDEVKKIVATFYEEYFIELKNRGILLLNTLSLDNYRMADAVRAFFDYEVALEEDKISNFKNRWHAHAVSSAFGLLGYDLGCEVLIKQKLLSPAEKPGYFLIQHLATPDLVAYIHNNSFELKPLPNYTYDESKNLFFQNEFPFLPYYTHDVREVLEPTFYSRKPFTASKMKNIINTQGGGGIVVSLAECIDRYSLITDFIKNTNIKLPSDYNSIREWSFLMTFTGVLNAIDRLNIPKEKQIIIHACGLYLDEDIKAEHYPFQIEINKENGFKKIKEVVYQWL